MKQNKNMPINFIIPITCLVIMCCAVYMAIFRSPKSDDKTKYEVAKEMEQANIDYSDDIKVSDEIGDSCCIVHYVNNSDRTLMVRDIFGTKKHNNNYTSTIIEPGEEAVSDAYIYEDKVKKLIHNISATEYTGLDGASINDIKVTDKMDDDGNLAVTIKNNGGDIDHNVFVNAVFYDENDNPIRLQQLKFGSYDYVIPEGSEISDTIDEWEIPDFYSRYEIYKTLE